MLRTFAFFLSVRCASAPFCVAQPETDVKPPALFAGFTSGGSSIHTVESRLLPRQQRPVFTCAGSFQASAAGHLNTSRPLSRDFHFRLFASLPDTSADRMAVRLSQSPSNSGTANGTDPSSSPIKGSKGNSRPHLIELTSANWRPLKSSEKFAFFWQDLLHWQTHASLVLDSGITLATGGRPYLGSGGKGFLKIYGFDAADEANFTFFNAFFFPWVFHEDPRYIPLEDGSTARRFFYALDRIVVARNDSGNSEFNKANFFGTLIATSLSSIYYSGAGADVSAGGNFASMGINMGSQAAFNLFKEFWPELARKLNLSVTIRNQVRNSIRDHIKVQ